MRHSFVQILPLLSLFAAASSQAFRVESFSPEGTVKNARQVVARFSEAMVSFGDPRAAVDPWEVECPGTKGRGRWVDSREWAYDFEEDLAAGLSCVFKLRADLKSAKGAGLDAGATATFRFDTGGVNILRSNPWAGEYSSIDEDQAFVLELDAVVDPASLKGRLQFVIEGIASPVGFKLVEGATRKRLFKMIGEKKENAIVIQAAQSFPNDSRVTLVWGRGIRTKSGVATTQDQRLEFKVRPPLRAEFSCTRENSEAACLPLEDMNLRFTAPVPTKFLRATRLRSSDGKLIEPFEVDEKQESGSSVRFKAPLPANAEFQVIVPDGVKDLDGRRLENQSRFPLATATTGYPPLAKFPGTFGIVESKAGALLPVTLRKLEPQLAAKLKVVDAATPGFDGVALKVQNEGSAIVHWLSKVQHMEYGDERGASIFDKDDKHRAFQVPKPNGGDAFEVVGIPLEKPGLYVVELESPALGRSLLGPQQGPMYVRTAALVTNLAVHLKWGDESSLVWVTSLDKGQPVPKADVEIYDCEGTSLWRGRTDSDGRAAIRGGMSLKWRERANCSEASYFMGGLLAVARLGDDMSFTSSSWNRGIEYWRFQLPYVHGYESQKLPFVHPIFDRTLFRAGDTMHVKLVARQRTMEGFKPAPASKLVKLAHLVHGATNQKYEVPLKWSANGHAEAEWKIPADAKLGSYDLELKDYGSIGQFRVEEFRVPLMKGLVSAEKHVFVAPKKIPLRLSAQYLAGGPAERLPVKVRSLLGARGWEPGEEYESYDFGSTAMQEGVRRHSAWEDRESETPKGAQVVPLTLDATGGAQWEFAAPAKLEQPMRLEAEMEYMDPNGAIQTAATDVILLPSERMVGLKLEGWVAVKDKIRAQVVVLDFAKKPVPHAKVVVTSYSSKQYSHRKRIVGGFFAYDTFNETKNHGVLCEVETDAKGLATCEGPANESGYFYLQAATRDSEGRSSYATRSLWVSGESNAWFSSDDHDRMDVLPERTRYEPGETAKIQVRVPFREATALVAIEREGVIETFVRPISSKDSTIELPVKSSYAPNVYVSVLVVRGRVGDAPPPTGLVDLAKPAFRYGIGEIKVGWKAHELKVSVKPDREEYRVREKAKLSVDVRTADGKAPPAGTEVTLAAVDEGLLQMSENKSWDLLRAMMGRRFYKVDTATAQSFVIGKRHFGQKALPPGGGGGRTSTRELFDTLLLWKSTVLVDASGHAEIEVPLNDSVTAFRIAAMAVGGVELFGHGEATIRSTQDLMLLPGLPPLVRNGDRFPARVTVRNGSARELHVEAKGACTGGCSAKLAAQKLSLKAGEARTVEWPVEVPADVSALEFSFEGHAEGGASDRVKAKQKVVDPVPVRVYQAQLDRLDQPRMLELERPQDAIAGRGGVRLLVSPSLSEGALEGVRTKMGAYPYTCLEQQTSRAVALADEKAWATIRDKLPAYVDGAGLFKYFPLFDRGSVVLTAYVLAVTHEAGWQIPVSVRERALSALEAFVSGRAHVGPSTWAPPGSLALEKLSALEALSRYRKVKPQLAESLTVEPNLWPTSGLLDWRLVLMRNADWPQRAARLAETEKILKSRLNYQGSAVNFAGGPATNLFASWFMNSGDADALRVLLAAADDAAWSGELPRLVRGAIARQKRGAWDLTTANAWGRLALDKFSRLHEKTPVDGKVRAELAGQKQESAVKAKAPASIAFAWPAAKATLQASFAGSGQPWLTTQSSAALPLREPLSTGLRLDKKIEAVTRRHSKVWSVGDVVRVKILVDAQTDLGWVAIDDPVPAGSQVLGTGLGNDSKLADVGSAPTAGVRRLWPSFQERSFEGMRSYYDFVPKGVFELEYTYRLNQPGTFRLPTTRAEALYAPETMGELPNAEFKVEP